MDEKPKKPKTQKHINPLEELINSALIKHYSEQDQKDSIQTKAHIETQKSIDHMITLLSEYLDDYIIVGHDISGTSVSLMHGKTQKDRDAVLKLFGDTFIKVCAKQSGSEPPIF